jgi:acyl-CoA oxidase
MKCQVPFIYSALQVHCSAFMLSSFIAAITTAPSASIRRLLSNVATVFACNVLLEAPVAAYLSSTSKRVTQHALEVALDTLRPDCVALVDAFDFPDSVLNSTIGRKDGNVYEALYEAAKSSSLNRQDPFVGYSEIWSPRLDKDFLQEGAAAHRTIGTHMTSKL